MFDFPGKYYLTLATEKTFSPKQLRDGSAVRMFDLRTDNRAVPPTVSKLIVWQDGPLVPTAQDPVLKSLGPDWSRQTSVEHAARDFWCWRRMFRCRRSVYLRAGN